MIKFPYGIADFCRIRREERVYVDRSAHIRDLEDLGDTLVFLRPRRFGKSLWLQTLATYYDLRLAGEHEELFGNLAIGRDPTPLAHRYFVLQWNFSTVDPSGGVERIAESLREHVSSQAKVFAREYGTTLPATIEAEGSSAAILRSILSAVSETPYKLCLLIDEYDNFVNEVMATDVDTYRALFAGAGPYKQLFKAVKNATEGQGLERVFVTGVSPVALNDLTSGFNNAEDVSLVPELAALCGFREQEIAALLEDVASERGLSAAAVEEALAAMRTWYNGHRFARDEAELLYNPTNVLYFLKHLQRYGEPPEQLHDENLRTDRGKLAFLAHTAAGAGVIEQLTEGGDGTVEVTQLATSFSLDDLTQRMKKDPDAVASMLYYMGLLTLTEVPFRLRIPNLVARRLFLERRALQRARQAGRALPSDG